MTNQTSLNVVASDSDLKATISNGRKNQLNAIHTAFDNVSCGVLYLSLDGNILCHNNTLLEQLSLDPSKNTPQSFHELTNFIKTKVVNYQDFVALFSLPIKSYFETQIVIAEMHDGKLLSCSSKSIIKDDLIQGFVWSVNDITEHKNQERIATYKSLHDSLTKLPNRACLYEKLEEITSSDDAKINGIAVLFLDLDNFKQINDQYGHGMGDQLLLSCAGRIRNALRAPDLLARLSGDEFVIILDNTQKEELVLNVIERINNSLANSFNLSGVTLNVTLSIGVSFFPKNGALPHQLIRQSDIAMYQAKRNGRNTFCFYDSSMES